MVVVAHLVLENALLLPGGQIKCTLNLVNKHNDVISDRGPYSSNLVQIFYEESFREKKERVVYYTAKPRDEDLSQIWTVEKVYGQVNGMCICDEGYFGKLENAAKHDVGEGQLETLVPRKANTLNIFTSQPKLFPQFNNLVMRVDEKMTVNFSFLLPPNEIPPSYKGATIRYIYFVNVSLRVSNPKIGTLTKVLRLPFKIYNPMASLVPILSSLPDRHEFEWSFDNIHHEPNGFYFAFREIQDIVSRNSTSSHYDITHNSQPICRFSLSTTAYHLGDTVLGLFDFATKSKSIIVERLRTELIFEEKIIKSKDSEIRTSQTSVAYFVNNVENMLSTNFSMMIPPQSPAQFSTDLIDVKWYLRFMFNVRGNDQVEVMEWCLPIQVFVPSDFRPLHTQSHSRETCMLLYY